MKTKPVPVGNLKQLTIAVSDLLYEDRNGNVYNRVMKFMVDMLHFLTPDHALCADALSYATTYWIEEQGDDSNLLHQRSLLSAYLTKHDLWYKQNHKPADQIKVYLSVLQPFNAKTADENCDKLYFFIENLIKLGIPKGRISETLAKYFPDV